MFNRCVIDVAEAVIPIFRYPDENTAGSRSQTGLGPKGKRPHSASGCDSIVDVSGTFRRHFLCVPHSPRIPITPSRGRGGGISQVVNSIPEFLRCGRTPARLAVKAPRRAAVMLTGAAAAFPFSGYCCKSCNSRNQINLGKCSKNLIVRRSGLLFY